MPKPLLLTAAVTQNGINPTTIPFMNKVKKLNHSIPYEKYLISSK